MPDLMLLRWRQGRTLKRAVFAVVDERDCEHNTDVFIGIFDDGEIAAEIVDMHNARVATYRRD